MNELKRIVADMESVFAQSNYPQDFLSAYDQMECLASHTGRETFLVRRKKDGETAVATCYDRSVFPFHPDIGLLKGLDHPGLPHYFEQFQNEQMLCVVREYIEGEPLSVYARERQMTIPEITAMAAALCDILETLHSHVPPVVHRDIKPENIIVKPDGGIALIDFDIARAVKEHAEADTVYFGTRGYAPPEQYGFGQTDARTDIYAFGVLLRWLVTGSVQENGNITIDETLHGIITRCTAFAPEQRYDSVGQIKQALSGVGRKKRRLSPIAGAGLAAAVLLLLCAGFLLGRYTSFLKPAKRIVFQEPLIEKAARKWIGKETGALAEDDLARVTRLYIFGGEAFSDTDAFYRCDIAGRSPGSIRTLDDLAMLPNLEEIHIVHQGYVDTAGIAGLPKLITVELKHMRLSGAAAIADAPGLRHAILFCDGLTDVTVLEKCPLLETLDIGLNSISSLSQVGRHPNVKSLGLMWLEMDDVNDIFSRLPKVQAVMLQHGNIRDLSGLKALPDLRAVYVLAGQEEQAKALFEGTAVQVYVTEN